MHAVWCIFAEDKMRFGSIKLSETTSPLLAVALTFHYLCRRYSCTLEIENKFSFRSFAISLQKI